MVVTETFAGGEVMSNESEWEAERRASRERSELVKRYERPALAVRAMHLPGAPIVRTMSHRDIDEVLGEGKER